MNTRFHFPTRGRAVLVFLLPLLLTACGGGGGGDAPPPAQTYTVGGTVSGLAGGGLVLQNNATDDLTISADGAFSFATRITDGGAYAVTVRIQPSGPSQTCSVGNGSGNIAGANVANVTVTCVTDTFPVGGTVSGLAGSGLVLQNNGSDDLAISADGAFVFSSEITDGGAYAVTVRTQPTGPSQTCTVSNGGGTLAGDGVTDVQVSCVTDTFTVGGTVTGLTAVGLVLRNNGGDDLAVDADGGFQFTTEVPSGGDYAVSVAATPNAPNHACYASRNRGMVEAGNVTGVVITCQSLAGNFIDAMTRSGPNDGTDAIAVGDVDGDGDRDLVRVDRRSSAIQTDYSVTVWRNDGKGEYALADTLLDADTLGIGDVALDDFDGDGDLDLFIARGHAGDSVVWRNDGTGGFADSGQGIGQGGGAWQGVVVTGDVDGDGDRDMVITTDSYTQGIEVLLNDGSGRFDTGLLLDAYKAVALSLADFDADGDFDLLVGHENRQSSLWINTNGVFADSGQRLGETTDRTHGSAAGDLNGDGLPDAVLSGDPTRVFINDGTGRLVETQAMAGTGGLEAALGDLDGDGDLDLLLTSAAWDTYTTIWINDGNGSFSDAGQWLGTSASSNAPSEVILADIDGDTDLDALIGNRSGAVDLALNNGAGRLAVVGARISAPGTAMAHADFDGDGDLDRIGSNQMYQNDGAGNFRRWPAANNLGGNACDAVAALDLDNKDGPDALCSRGNASYVYLNGGSGILSSPSYGASAFSFGGQIIVKGDLDGDGDADVVIGNDALVNQVWLSDGDGTFTSGANVGATPTLDLALGDLDGDGGLDLVEADTWSGISGGSLPQSSIGQFWLNDGSATFSRQQVFRVPTYTSGNVTTDSTSVALGDIDGDGDTDAILGQNDRNDVIGAPDQVWLYDAITGTFQKRETNLPIANTRDVRLGDLDGDGDLDLVVAEYGDASTDTPIRLLLNDGTGVFTAHLTLGEGGTLEVELLDLDGDGDLDIVTRGAATGFDAVYINQTR